MVNITGVGAVIAAAVLLVSGQVALAPATEGSENMASAVSSDNAEFPVTPAPGEQIVIEGPQGELVTYTGVTASCSVSASAYQPYKANGYAKATVVVQNGSGCPSRVFSGQLFREACGALGCWNRLENSKSYTVAPGSGRTIFLEKACGNSDSDRWRSMLISGTSNFARTNWGWLACGM